MHTSTLASMTIPEIIGGVIAVSFFISLAFFGIAGLTKAWREDHATTKVYNQEDEV